MNGSTYETVSRLAQQAGTLYFAVIFAVAIGWALWPRHKAAYDDAAQIPFREQPPAGDVPAADPAAAPLSPGEL